MKRSLHECVQRVIGTESLEVFEKGYQGKGRESDLLVDYPSAYDEQFPPLHTCPPEQTDPAPQWQAPSAPQLSAESGLHAWQRTPFKPQVEDDGGV
jgi:hypothetical protein